MILYNALNFEATHIYQAPYISKEPDLCLGEGGTTLCLHLKPRSWSAGRNIPKYPRSKPQDPSDDGTVFVFVDCFKRFPLLRGRFR